MTLRDLAWRGAGALLFVGSSAASALRADDGLWTLAHFVAGIIGIVLMINGKHVATVWRAERRGHCNTAAAVHAARVERQRRTRR